MTYLEIINQVLRRLRQDEVTSIDQSDYSKLVGDMVNESKREVEDAFRWSHLRRTIERVQSGGAQIFLGGFTDRCRIESVFCKTTNIELQQLTEKEWQRMAYRPIETGNAATGDPLYWRISTYAKSQGVDTNGASYFRGDPIIDIYPVTVSVYEYRFNAWAPQHDFTEGSTEMWVPHWPVILGAYARAVSERGEDQGMSFADAQRLYTSALNDAIATDNNMRGGGEETDWVIY